MARRVRSDGKVTATTLDRIMIYRKHSLVPINHVNPIYINDLEQSHMVAGSPIANHLAGAKIANHLAGAKIANHLAGAKMAIPTNHDLLYTFGAVSVFIHKTLILSPLNTILIPV
jgi:hypothetical protein